MTGTWAWRRRPGRDPSVLAARLMPRRHRRRSDPRVGPPDIAHGFTNTGPGELRVTAIHGHPRFITEWLAEHDGTWV
jgi:hypothetical protein